MYPSFCILFFVFFFFSSPTNAATWKKIRTEGSYTPRGEVSFSRCGNSSMCLVGGRGDNLVNLLDTVSLSWSNGAFNSIEMHHFQGVRGPDSCVWVAGAWTGPFPNEDTVNNIWKYCPTGDVWKRGSEIPRPRGSGGAAFYRGKLYLVSGNVGGHNPDAKVVPWFDCYDPATNKWTTLPDVPNRSNLYVVGGRLSTTTLPEFFDAVEPKVDVYNFKTSTWTTLPDFPRPRAGASTAVLDGKIYVLGGEGSSRAWTEVDVLRDSSFFPGPELPEPRHGTGVVSCGGALWIAGGTLVQGGGENAADTYAFFDGQLPPQCTTSGSSETTTQKPTEVSSTPVAVPVPPLPSPSASLFPTSTGAKPPAEASNSPSAGTATSGTPQQSQEPQPGAEDNNNPEESPSIGGDSDSNSACFPSDATVQLPDGTVKQMAELQIGDRVKVAPPDTFSEVFFFSHNHKDRMTTSVKIETSINGIGLTASPGHMLYANGKRVPASAVRVGDEVSVSHDSEHAAIVTSVQRVETVGLHNPHTLHGDIVVDGVVASTYTTAVHPVVAWMALAPFRAAYHAFGASDKLETLNRAILRTLDVAVWE